MSPVEKRWESSFRVQRIVRVAGTVVAATLVTESNTFHIEGMLAQEPCTPVGRSAEA
jgi:hypothetical protein